MGRLQGKAAMITGGASGFGAGIVDMFARESASVLIADLDGDAAEAQAGAVGAAGGKASALAVDVTRWADNEAMVAEFMGGTETAEGREAFRANLPLGKLIRPEDMGEAALFLADDGASSRLTGVTLPVDSGRTV